MNLPVPPIPRRALALRAYGLATWLAQPLLRRKLRRRALAEPGYGEVVEERFGRYGEAARGTGWCWVHAVSLGEARAAGILITALRAADPRLRLLLTHGTATGRAEGARWLRPGDLQVWQPWDSPGAVARFLDRFRPRVGVLMETEVWPELTAACAERGLPLALANARLSAKSLAAAERLPWLSRPAYRSLAAVWAQSDDDAARLASLGAPVAGVFGNLKFDAAPDEAQLAQGRAWRVASGRPVVLLASSREGEEAQWLAALSGLRRPAAADSTRPPRPEPQWLVVPRHPQRFDQIEALIRQAGLSVSRRSASAGVPPAADVWLGDSLGEMALYYALADVALLGGSFEALGGQNLIEAAACGCPVVMGPSTFNFAEAATLSIAAGASLRVADLKSGVDEALGLLAEPERRNAMVRAALGFSKANRGCAQRTASAVLALASEAEQRSNSRA
ncbi:MAG: 3-deoxy-D-manno-octulosonic acid transferase [Comamonadaceae bacterium]|nr:MAG: 3-deoxy-D-manno-octulosonic acid transferase [Comamonadaceae bacterium]